MRLGIIAYATQTGLGYQTREYVSWLKPDKVLLIDLSKFNRMPLFMDWYRGEDVQLVHGIPSNEDIDLFLKEVDIVFYAETPLNYYLHERAKELGIKVVQAYNYEFLDYFRHPEYAGPSVLAGPTVWNIDKVKELNAAPVEHWPMPVNRDVFKFRQRTECKRVSHIIGRPAVKDRNGTLSFLRAIEKIGQNANIEYYVYLQEPKDLRAVEYFEPVRNELNRLNGSLNLHIVIDTQNCIDLYKNTDLLVLPRRYGGLCLPMQEALSCGVPVIMTDVDPNNAILPSQWLVPAKQIDIFRGHAEIPIYDADVDILAKTIRAYTESDIIESASLAANEIAESLSWSNLLPQYNEWFCKLFYR